MGAYLWMLTHPRRTYRIVWASILVVLNDGHDGLEERYAWYKQARLDAVEQAHRFVYPRTIKPRKAPHA